MQDITASPGLKKLFENMEQPTATVEHKPFVEEEEQPIIEEKKPVEEKPIPKVDKATIDASAEIAIDMIDGVQTTIFKLMGTAKKIKKANEIIGNSTGLSKLKKAVAIDKTNNKANTTMELLSSKDVELIELNEAVESFINDLGFTPKQIESLKKPMAFLIEQNAGQIPMGVWVAVGLGNAIGANAAALMAI